MAAVAVVALLAACGAAQSQQAEAVTAPAPATALVPAQQALAAAGPTLDSQRSDDLVAWLSSRPAQPLRGAAEMDAYLLGAEGQPVTDAKVTFDTDMTNMSHGPYLVTAEPAGDGHYVGQVHFSMPGPWRVIAIVERPGRETAKLRFEFTVNMK
jgi:hypothetical protein